VKIKHPVVRLRPQSEPALFSERNRRMFVIPLFFGWRITIRKVA